jgi:Spy/CpxP family protein refolding chaperone
MADLNLTEEQKAKFRELNSDHRKQIAELKKQDNITVKDSKEKMAALRKDHRARIQALLTPEQKSQLERKRAERHSKMGDRHQDFAAKMKKELNLTDEQSAKLDASRKAAKEKMQAIRADKSLSAEQVRTKTKEIRKEQVKTMKSILTEEQLKKMKEGKKHDRRKKMDA